MIRIEPIDYRNNRERFESMKQELPDVFRVNETGRVLRVMRRNDQPCGYFTYKKEDDNVRFAIRFFPDTDDRRKLLAVVCEKMVRMFHPEKLIIDDDTDDYKEIYFSNSFHQTEHGYQKIVEPWRKILNDRVFDEEGFIINQGMMKDIPFGWFDTKAKGCGWIAAYNLLKMLGKETEMARCAKELEKGAFLGELMGENYFKLFAWLKKQGLDVSMSFPTNRSALKKIAASPCGIILYNHARGAHYVTYRNLGKGNIQIYNAVYGKRSHVMNSAEFIRQFSLFPVNSVIAVKRS